LATLYMANLFTWKSFEQAELSFYLKQQKHLIWKIIECKIFKFKMMTFASCSAYYIFL
jgi:hypothetical protein